MSWQSIKSSLQKYKTFIDDHHINYDQLIANIPISIQTLAFQYKPLLSYERKCDQHLDSGTSGESSPCYSETETELRVSAPTLLEVSELLLDEASLETESNLLELNHIKGDMITLIFENVKPSLELYEFETIIKRNKSFNIQIDRPSLQIKKVSRIFYRKNPSILAEFQINRLRLPGDSLMRLQEDYKFGSSVGNEINILWVRHDKRLNNNMNWFMIVVRNLPPTVVENDLLSLAQSQKDISISVGPITKIKSHYCCLIRCESIEDAEMICKKINGFPIKTHLSDKKYYLKVSFILFLFSIIDLKK